MFSKDSIIDTAPTSLIDPFDTVTVVSQRSLNARLKQVFDATPALHSASFKPPADEEDDFASFDAEFDAPKVELQLFTENKIVILVLSVKKATLKYLKVSGRKVTDEIAQIPPFKIAINVDIVADSVQFSSLPETLQNLFASSKDLSIRGSVMNFKDASLARLRNEGTTLYSVVPDTAQAALISIYMEQYLKLLGEHQDALVFHYVATSPSAEAARDSYPVPAIVPTGRSTYQNLPTHNANEHADPCEDSLLAYLAMTEGAHLPRGQLPLISGKWVNAIDATADAPIAVMSKAKFLEDTILAKLAEVNKASTWLIDDAWVDASILPPEVKYSLTGHLGWVDAPQSDIAWTPISFADVPGDARVKVKGPGAWYHYKHADYKAGKSKLVFEVSQRATTENFIFVPEGMRGTKTEISIFGRTLVDFYTKMEFSSSSGWVMNEWSTKVNFDSSKQGEPVVVSTEDISTTTTADGTDEELGPKVIGPAKAQLEEFRFSLKDLGETLKAAFEKNWPFFLPTHGGPLYIDKAFFGKGLDLVCLLKPHEVNATK